MGDKVPITHSCGHVFWHHAWGRRVSWLETKPCPECAGVEHKATKSEEPQKTIPELVAEAGLKEPMLEYRFTMERRWRFDIAWPEVMIAIEIDGGIFARGKHSRGAGILRDHEKQNWAVLHGWRVLRCTMTTLPKLLEELHSGALIKR